MKVQCIIVTTSSEFTSLWKAQFEAAQLAMKENRDVVLRWENTTRIHDEETVEVRFYHYSVSSMVKTGTKIQQTDIV